MKAYKKVINTENDITEAGNQLISLDLEKGPYILILAKKRKKRTVNQNAWLAAWINLIKENTGMTYNEVYTDLLQQCSDLIETRTVKGESILVPRSSSQMDTLQFSEFMDKVHAYIIEALEIDLPFPDNNRFNDFMFQYQSDNYDNLIEEE
jgi:hypothetical protein